MELFITLILFAAGLIMIIKGGDFFVDAASWMAEISGIPKFIIGATIVAPNAALMAEEKLAVLMGSEGDGLTEQTIASCDYTVKIPMYHGVDSLNVAAASAVAFWQLCNKGE